MTLDTPRVIGRMMEIFPDRHTPDQVKPALEDGTVRFLFVHANTKPLFESSKKWMERAIKKIPKLRDGPRGRTFFYCSGFKYSDGEIREVMLKCHVAGLTAYSFEEFAGDLNSLGEFQISISPTARKSPQEVPIYRPPVLPTAEERARLLRVPDESEPLQ